MVKKGNRQTEVEIYKVSTASFPAFAVRRERRELTVIDKNIYLATSICRFFFFIFHFKNPWNKWRLNTKTGSPQAEFFYSKHEFSSYCPTSRFKFLPTQLAKGRLCKQLHPRKTPHNVFPESRCENSLSPSMSHLDQDNFNLPVNNFENASEVNQLQWAWVTRETHAGRTRENPRSN